MTLDLDLICISGVPIDEMTIQVRYLSEEEIERDSVALQLGVADLHEMLGIPMLRDQPDILCAIWVDKEIILIDRSWLP